jgi:hypothetical protein
MLPDLREQACWITLVFESGLTTRVVNDILVSWCYQHEQNLQTFFAADPQRRAEICSLKPEAVQKIEQAHEKLAAQAFLVEQLANASISMLTLFDNEYPRLLKSALKRDQTLPIVCSMGNLGILQRQAVALIGSREWGTGAETTSLCLPAGRLHASREQCLIETWSSLAPVASRKCGKCPFTFVAYQPGGTTKTGKDTGATRSALAFCCFLISKEVL